MGVVSFAKQFVMLMVWLIVGMIVAFAILGYAEDKGGSNILGRFATWVNDRARPQAS